jgi:hypothetical protein
MAVLGMIGVAPWDTSGAFENKIRQYLAMRDDTKKLLTD